MKKIFLCIIFFLPLCVSAQRQAVTLTPPSKIDVEYIVDDATLGFNREDIRAIITALKKQYNRASRYDSLAFEKALLLLNETTTKIVIVQFDSRATEGQEALGHLFQMHIAATLLRQGKATVVNKSSGKSETQLEWTYPQTKRRDTLFTFTAGGEQLLRAFTHSFERVREKTQPDEITITGDIVFNEPVLADDPTTYDKIFLAVEQPPEPPGGQKAYSEYLKKNQQYSKKDRKTGIEGKVYVKFIVNKDGSLEELEVLKGINVSLDKEALRLIREGGTWTPGRQDGRHVRSRFVQPVTFTPRG